MFVADIYEDVREVLNFPDEATTFRRITDAVEAICNQGNFDSVHGFVDIPITEDGLILLPRDVEVPIKVNLNGNPTFSRDKFFEFTLDGPGSNDPLLGWQWQDKQSRPLKVAIPSPTAISVQSSAADDGLTVTLYGRAADNGVIHETLILDADTNPVSGFIYKEVNAFHKDVTTQIISLYTDPDGLFLGNYAALDTEPLFRSIRVSATSGVAKVMFRRNRFEVRSQQDFIPIRSKIALTLMCQALEQYRNEQVELGQALEKLSITKANEQQKSNSAFIDLAAQEEVATMLNLNLNNRDTLIVADVYDDACAIFGPIGRQKILDKLTEACTILSNKAQWDAQKGFVDITTDQYRFVTLPRYVDDVLKLNLNRREAMRQSNWFMFHGATERGGSQDWVPCQNWEPVPGTVCTYRDLPYTQFLAVVPDLDADLDVVLRVYGYYQGKRIYTTKIDGTNEEGFLVTASADGLLGSPQPIDRIERITKSMTRGFVKLYGRDSANNNQIQIGYYWPDETEPNYKRIKLPQHCTTIRICYRRKELKFTTLTDPLHLKSKTAVTNMLSALKQRDMGKHQDAEVLEQKAVQYLSEEQSMLNQSEIPEVEFDKSFRLRYVN